MNECQRAAGLDLATFLVEREAPEWAAFREHYASCSSCAKQVAGWSRVMNALRDEAAGASSEHPSEERLLQFETARATLSARDAEAVERHLAACAPCRSELKLLRSFDFASVRAPATAPEPRREARESWLSRLADLLRGSFVLSLPRPALAFAALLVIALPIALSRWTTTSSEAPVSVAQEEPARAPSEAPAASEPVPRVPEEPAPEIAAEPEPTPPAVARVEPTPAAPPVAAPEPTTPPREEPAPEQAPLVAGPAVELAALVPSEPPAYAADLPLIGAHSPVRVAGVVRSGGEDGARVQALGPDHTGVVFEEAPTLYWVLSKSTSLPVELIVTDASAVQPLVETTLPGPTRAGIHAFDLEAFGARLRPGVDYEWSVSLVADPEDRSGDAVSKAGVRFEKPSGTLAAQLASAEPGQQAHAYAAAGSWYQAFEQLSRWIEREPDAEVLRRHRTALLEQVDLAWVATLPENAGRP